MQDSDTKKDLVVFDGKCQFCLGSIEMIRSLDSRKKFQFLDFQLYADPSAIDGRLTREQCHSQMHVLTPSGGLYGGFFAFRYLARRLPILWPFLLILFFPGMDWLGPKVYGVISRNRYLFHRKKNCRDNHCSR